MLYKLKWTIEEWQSIVIAPTHELTVSFQLDPSLKPDSVIYELEHTTNQNLPTRIKIISLHKPDKNHGGTGNGDEQDHPFAGHRPEVMGGLDLRNGSSSIGFHRGGHRREDFGTSLLVRHVFLQQL
ncbi:MAG TPA: hypothetical protein VLU25_08775, partial [Acidobacteriota bacterium]|nr:hypothetical protein [Acidobacteriota bacterium]